MDQNITKPLYEGNPPAQLSDGSWTYAGGTIPEAEAYRLLGRPAPKAVIPAQPQGLAQQLVKQPISREDQLMDMARALEQQRRQQASGLKGLFGIQ